MAEYLSDQEQIEVIKQWWKDYGKFLMIAIIIGVLIGFGWRWWHVHRLNNTLQASQLYQQMLIADAKMDKANSVNLANAIIHDHPKTPYATMANFLLAKDAVVDNHLTQAVQYLQWVIDHGQNPSFRQMARIRMARVLLEQKKNEQALQVLQTIDDKSFMPEINAVKGDIFMAGHELAKARAAYSLAQKQFIANSMEDNILQLKLTAPAHAKTDVTVHGQSG